MGLTRSEVADWLLQEQFLLTALEFHTELLESGTELQLLSSYFSNPANFETDTVNYCASPQSSLGTGEASFEFAPNSNVGEDDVIKQKDQKIALLEFELRQTKEQMKVLRSRATTSLTDSQNASSELARVEPVHSSFNQNTPKPSESIPAPARPHTPPPPVIVTPAADGGVLVGNENASPLEKRAINFICNHYLQQCGYKLTAITFADENEDQDFEDWEDVGLAMAQPPSLLHFYRSYYAQSRPTPSPRQPEIQNSEQQKLENAFPGSSLSRKDSKGEVAAATAIKREDSIGFRRTESEARRVELSSEIEQDLTATRQRLEALKRNNEELRSENETLKSKVQVLEDELQTVASTRRNRKSTESLDDDSFDPLSLQREFSLSTSLQRPNAFRRAVERVLIHGSTKNRLAQEVLHIKQHKDDAVEVLARSLPNIVPHVLLNKREELLPVILVTIMRHKDAKVRDRLTHMLFNLIKRPDEIQRRVIITGSMALAEGIGPTRCEAELMPQCWEQITHKFPERRTLVAEACGVLARYLKVELRSSLTLSILQQLTEDSNDLVRQAAVKNMGLLVSYVQDPQKYQQVEDLLLRALTDRSDRVVRAAQAYMLPSLAQWACELRTFQNSLVPNIISDTLHQLEKNKSTTTTSGPVDVYTLCCQLEALLLLVPFVYAILLRTAPFSAIEDVDPSGVGDDSLLSVQDFADAAAEEPSWMESLGGGTVEEDSGDDQDGLPPMASAPAWMEAGHRRNHSVDSRRSNDLTSGNTSPQKSRKTQQQNALKMQRRKSELRHADNPLYSLTTLLGDDTKQRVLRQSLDDFLGIYSQAANTPQVHDVTWDTFTWVKTEWLPGIVQVVSQVPPSAADGVALCSRLIFAVCRTFGPVFAEVIVRPLFTVIFDGSSADADTPEGAALRLHLLPVYINGLLRAGGEDAWKDVVACIQQMVINMALEQNHWKRDGLSTITLICTEFCQEEEGAVDHLMAVIWELVCHQSSAVRAALAYVFTAVVPLASVSLLKDRLVPAFITLSNDTDIDVRNTVVPCFGMVLEHSTDRNVVDKVKMQLQSLCEVDDENAEKTMCVVVRTLAAVLAKVESALRDDFILPRLYHVATRLANRPHSASNKMTASALVRAYQNAMNCYIKSPILRDVLHPGLLALHRCSAHLSLAELQTVESLTKQCETKFEDRRDSVSTIGSAAASTRERILGLFHKDEDKEDKTSFSSLGASSNALAGMFRRNPNSGPR